MLETSYIGILKNNILQSFKLFLCEICYAAQCPAMMEEIFVNTGYFSKQIHVQIL